MLGDVSIESGEVTSTTRRVLVTGGASGIGAATVAAFRLTRARVALVDTHVQGAQVEADAVVTADVSNWDSIRSGVESAARSLGGLDVVVCCAGVSARGTVADTEISEWDRVFDVNVRGSFLTAKAAIPYLLSSGCSAIVNVASQLGVVAAADAAAYCASKAAVIQLTRSMALDLAADGIRVNSVSPGPTATPMNDVYFGSGPNPRAERDQYERTLLHGRMIAAKEIADAIVYLASPGAASIFGENLIVDAGYTIH